MSHLTLPVRQKTAWLALALSGLFALGTAAPVAAQHRRARLSADLADRVGRDTDATRVIVQGTAEQVEGLARRHGLSIRRYLRGGAVVNVRAGSLAAVVNDDQLDHASLDAVVHS